MISVPQSKAAEIIKGKNNKPTILLCWGYNRKNWVEFFEALNNDFEFVYLFYMYPHEEQEVFTENKEFFILNTVQQKNYLETYNRLKWFLWVWMVFKPLH